jgi:hypothetical protein
MSESDKEEFDETILLEKEVVKTARKNIVRVCWAWKSPDDVLHREWRYECAYASDIKQLKKKWYDVEVVGRIIDEKSFTRGSMTSTTYYVYKCDDANTYIEKFRIESGNSWSITVKSDVPYEHINNFDEAEEAWKKAFLKENPPNCTFLAP